MGDVFPVDLDRNPVRAGVHTVSVSVLCKCNHFNEITLRGDQLGMSHLYDSRCIWCGRIMRVRANARVRFRLGAFLGATVPDKTPGQVPE